ncbi:MAG TPA: peptidylprolyl isomerase [Myxococcales bacterium]|nr:peptidylprolyl isomerase [Myxococcales bacterium]
MDRIYPTLSHALSLATVRPAAGARTRNAAVALGVLLTLIIASCGNEETDRQASATTTATFAWPTGPHPRAVFHIENKGSILLELYPELAPKTVASFIELARSGFYDGTTFHRTLPGFMIQGGDPNSRDRNPGNDGEGGPGFTLPDEFSPAPHQRGTLSMANTGQPNSGGSQFFIVHGDARHLDGRHTVFGRVAAGIEVADAIAAAETDLHGRWGKPNRPLEDIVIERIEILQPPPSPTQSAPADTHTPTLRSRLGPEPPRVFPALAQR